MAHYDFVKTTRQNLLEAKPSSKNLWSKARRLTDRKQRVSSIPILKRVKDWILDAKEKANYFVNTLESKNVMIKEEVNDYSEIAYDYPTL